MEWLQGVLDWLYPPKCALCGLIGGPAICDECKDEFAGFDDPHTGARGNLDWVYSLFPFEGRAAQAVKRLKYSRVTSLGKPMSAYLEAARQRVADHDVIVPVPIHPTRRRWRGFNQADLLCQAMPPAMVEQPLMVRVKRTRPQVELKAKERLANLTGAFVAAPEVSGKRVLIVDDVVTTGGTAMACADALKFAGATEVGLLTFCGERSHFRTE